MPVNDDAGGHGPSSGESMEILRIQRSTIEIINFELRMIFIPQVTQAIFV